jgi:hypothetical protein
MPGPWTAPSTDVTGGLIDFRFLIHWKPPAGPDEVEEHTSLVR